MAENETPSKSNRVQSSLKRPIHTRLKVRAAETEEAVSTLNDVAVDFWLNATSKEAK